MPPTAKPSGMRQRRNRKDLAVVLEATAIDRQEPPDPQDAWLQATKARWAEFWSSQVALAVEVSDRPALLRLFSLYDERERAMRGYRARRTVNGSQGQPRVNPLAQVVATFDAEIRQLEIQFGMTPASRARLGISVHEVSRRERQVRHSRERYDVRSRLQSS